MKKPTRKVVIEVSGGNVQEIYSNDPSISIAIVDWDNIGQGDEGAAIPNVTPLSALGKESVKEVTRTLGKNWIKD